jgi:hypothetical protein
MVSAPLLCVPLVGSTPLHAPEAAQEVAFVELHANIAALPLATDAGDAVKLTVGRMFTVMLEAALVPPGPEQLKK